MKLRDVLNKITNDNFLLTINGVCDEDNICEVKQEEYYKKYRDKKVINMIILETNMQPELIIKIEE